MEKPIIEVRNIGKKYDINHTKGGYVALRDVLTNIARAPFVFLKSKTKQTIGLEKKEEFWALKDVSFNIKKGEVVGIIGANGAGKSTLLKILSQITPPTTGEIVLRGKVGSLLEVGTGFHPELTGRENIFLNGAILGMKKKEIAEKFDEIIAFAGVEKFLDTPVKYYSSGMYVRLAFSVAAHMDPDILIIDEVLAVGDAEFQKKCLGKMEEITRGEGRTILFVSHNMSAIQRLCDKTILLEKGVIKKYDNTTKVISSYLENTQSATQKDIASRKDRRGNGDLRITDCYIKSDGVRSNSAISGKDTTFILEYKCVDKKRLNHIVLGFNIATIYGEGIFLCHNKMTKYDFGFLEGNGSIECTIKNIPLIPNTYIINARILSEEILLDEIENVTTFEVLDGDFFGTGFSEKHSMIYVNHNWNIKK